jgi:hypothetical protein
MQAAAADSSRCGSGAVATTSTPHVLRQSTRAKAVIHGIDIDLTAPAVATALPGPSSKRARAAMSAAAASIAITIVLSSDDEEADTEVPPAARSEDEGSCLEISRPPSPLDESLSGSAAADADAELSSEGIAFIGCRGGLRPHVLPHKRSLCPVKRFTPGHAKRTTGGNSERCDKCWCYICDVMAANCPQWESNDTSRPAHCNAHDGGPLWRKLRNQRRRRLNPAPA